MLGRKQELNAQLHQLLDGFLLALAFGASHSLRYYGTEVFDIEKQIPPFSEFRWMLFIFIGFGPIFLELQGYYHQPMQKAVHKSLAQMARAAIGLSGLLLVCVVFLRLEVPSRSVLLIFALLAVILLLARERLSVLRLKHRAKTGRFRENVLLAGVPVDMEVLRRSFTPEQVMEIQIVEEIDIDTQPISSLVEALHKHSVSRVIFAAGHSHLVRLQEAIGACEIEGVEAWLVADFIKTSIARPDFDVLGSRPMLVFRTTPELSWALLVKGVMDRVGGMIGLIVFSPLFLIAAIGIKLSCPGPIIFRQVRAGKHGKPFTMYKFRSMNVLAEMHQAELEAHNEMTGPVFKVGNDPRITRFGRWLRKWSVDELPQLLNVVQGHMSLVGPRPLPIYEVEKFENAAQRRRLSVKPGLTCLWQVAGRNNVKDFHEWVKLDLMYIDNWSIWLDLKILLKTVPAVLLGMGAR